MTDNKNFHRCSFYLEKKNRMCRLLAKEDAKYCGEHSVIESKNRVLCPNDPKHTVFLNELENHLNNKCNARIKYNDYLEPFVNCVEKSSKNNCFIRPSLKKIIEISVLIEKYNDVVQKNLIFLQLHTPEIENYLENSIHNLSNSSKKHLIQLSSIIGHIFFNKLTKNKNDCFIEFGSGKAQLSYWMMKLCPDIKFLLVDKMGARNKYDNKALKENNSLNLQRLRCCIEHLNLKNVPLIKENNLLLIPVCKHLCGNATDYSIRCILNAKNNNINFNGFALAPCCHHKTTFNEYVGKDFLKSISICDDIDFSALRYIASWATCGFKTCNNNNNDNNGFFIKKENQNILNDDYEKLKTWSSEYKIELGKKAKLLLEYGRVVFLKKNFNAEIKMYAYVLSEISPENILIVGNF